MSIRVFHIITLIYLGLLSIYDIKTKQMKLLYLLLCIPITLLGIYSNFNISSGERIYGLCFGLLIVIISLVSKQAIGLADSLIVVFLGVTYGYTTGIGVTMISLILCSFFCILLVSIKRLARKQRIPFLPFLWTGCMVSFLKL